MGGIMLTESDFAAMDDCPTAQRLELLPKWAQTYEQGLRQVAIWWSIRQKSKRRFPHLDPPPEDRLHTLPEWCLAWFRTLKFEIWWQQQQVQPMLCPTRSQLFLKRKTKEGSTNAGTHRKAWRIRQDRRSRSRPQTPR